MRGPTRINHTLSILIMALLYYLIPIESLILPFPWHLNFLRFLDLLKNFLLAALFMMDPSYKGLKITE